MFYFAATTWLRISTLIKFSHSSNQTVLQSSTKYYSWLPLGILDFVCPSRPLALRPCITALCLFLISGWRDKSAEWEPSICGCMWAIFQRCGQKSFCTLRSVKLFISLQKPFCPLIRKKPPLWKNTRFGAEKKSEIVPTFLYGPVTYPKCLFCKKNNGFRLVNSSLGGAI